MSSTPINNIAAKPTASPSDNLAANTKSRSGKSSNEISRHYSPESLAIKDSVCRQMRCKHNKLRFSKTTLLCIYANLCWFCMGLAVFSFHFEQSMTQQEFLPYSDVDECKLTGFDENTTWGKDCTVNYSIDYDFDTPVYFYYKLTNFFQNHRRYVPSRSDDQLTGKYPAHISTCLSLARYNGEKIVPCGLVAGSFFNDKFNVTHIDHETGKHTQLCPFTKSSCIGDEQKGEWTNASWHCDGTWENKNVPWPSDKKGKFGATHLKKGYTNRGELQYWQNVTLPNTNDDDLIVWMRVAASSSFTKLHRINHQLKFKKGDRLMVHIKNYFAVSQFGGTKSLVISTANFIGGRNFALGIGFFVLGIVCAIAFVVFVFLVPQDKKSPQNT